MMVNVVVQFMY